MKTKYLILLIALLVLLCLGLTLYLLPRGEAAQAQVYSGGVLVATVDLNKNQELTVSTPQGGSNVLTVQDGLLAVTQASCPDHVCMHMGYRNAGQIVCLPNRLVIQFPASAADAIAG